MRNKDNFITTPKRENNDQISEFITVIIFEKSSNLKFKTTNFPFIKYNGKSLLEKQIEIINSSFKNVEIIFVCNNTYSLKIFEYIKKQKYSNVRIIENANFNITNCCESIRLGINNTFNNKLLIIPEDILLPSCVLKSININSNNVLVCDHNDDNNFEIGAIINYEILENLTIGIKQNYWTEMLFLGIEKSIKELREILFTDNFKNKLFFEAVNKLNSNQTIEIIKTSQCAKLNNAKTLKRVNS